VVDPATLENVAVMVTTPSVRPLTTPDDETLATALSLEVHLAFAVIDSVRLS
jgi:hypothetical protein